MLHFVTHANRMLYTDLLGEMHAWRKRIFVDALKWDLTVRDGGEYDEYDDDRAIYFLLTDDKDGSLLAAQRMRPTDDRSMLADHYAEAVLVKDRPLADEATWEMTRGFARPDRRGLPESERRNGKLFIIAQMEAGLACGIDRVVGFTDVKLVPWFVNGGYQFRILGLPLPYAEGSGIAFEYAVDEAAIARMRDIWAITDEPVFMAPELSATGVSPQVAGGEIMRAVGRP